MFRFFEHLVTPTTKQVLETPPSGIFAFYWFFLRQVRGLFASLIVVGFVLAALDVALPMFVGKIVKLVTTINSDNFIQETWPLLVGMASVVLIVRPLILLMLGLIQYQALMPGLTNLVLWQSHWHVVRQDITFFQRDVAGRIGNRVIETGWALRSSVISLVSVCWYLVALIAAAFSVLTHFSPWFAFPMITWAAGYVILLYMVVPRIAQASKSVASAHSGVVGNIVDSYSNISTIKLFAAGNFKDVNVRQSIDKHTHYTQLQMRWFTVLAFGMSILSGLLIAANSAIAIWLWLHKKIDLQSIVTSLPLTLYVTGVSSRIAYEFNSTLQQVGKVYDGMNTIAQPHGLADNADARVLVVTQGGVQFEDVSFGYVDQNDILKNISLSVKPGEKIGILGQSGAGKSTLISILLRFYDIQDGRILIDGQRVDEVTQDSLRNQISVVTQDTSLMNLSVLENIRLGKPSASLEDVVEAAKLASAHDFIQKLKDSRGRKGYEARVGDRGVTLSGGQRQRIAIARVILKDAPILILDEATSALDSELEAEIQRSFADLMAGKTVIAIAHRLSTIAAMDRLVVMNAGSIVEQGTHEELLALDKYYARLWERQSGGFLAYEPSARVGRGFGATTRRWLARVSKRRGVNADCTLPKPAD